MLLRFFPNTFLKCHCALFVKWHLRQLNFLEFSFYNPVSGAKAILVLQVVIAAAPHVSQGIKRKAMISQSLCLLTPFSARIQSNYLLKACTTCHLNSTLILAQNQTHRKGIQWTVLYHLLVLYKVLIVSRLLISMAWWQFSKYHCQKVYFIKIHVSKTKIFGIFMVDI